MICVFSKIIFQFYVQYLFLLFYLCNLNHLESISFCWKNYLEILILR